MTLPMDDPAVTTTTAPPDRPPRGGWFRLVNAGVSLAILVACGYGTTWLSERKPPARVQPPRKAGTPVVVEPLLPHSGPVVIGVSGVVVPLREIRLATEVAGRVVEQSDQLRPGRIVREGEMLIRLDPAEFLLEVRRLEAQQAQEAAELAAVEVSIENTRELLNLANEQWTLAKEERTRFDSLAKRQAASTAEVDLSRRAELTTRSGVVELENRRRDLVAQRELIAQKQSLTEVALQRAHLDLDRTTVRSPIRGRVVASTVEEQSFIATGTPFVTIEDISAVEVRCNLTADQMVWVWNSDAPARVGDGERNVAPEMTEASIAEDRVPAVPVLIQYRSGLRVTQWEGHLERIDGAGIDVATRTYPCLFRVDAPEQFTRVDASPTGSSEASDSGPSRLIRGMFVAVKMQTRPRRPLYQISERAIRPGNRIWLSENGRLRIASIEIVGRVGHSVVVDAGSFPGSGSLPKAPDVIVSPVSEPRDGMIVVAEESDAMPRTAG